MKLLLNIPDEYITDVLIAALEGGSKYWYNLPDITQARLNFPDKKMATSEKVIRSAMEMRDKIAVYDIEGDSDDAPLGYISRVNIYRGLKLWFERTKSMYHALIFDSGMDAGEADAFFQLVVIGEIVYG